MADWQVRDAAPDELAAAFAIFRDYEFHGGPAPSFPPIPDFFPHVAHTGRVLVAADGEQILGYAGAIARGEVTHLTDLFVRPAAQSGSVGRALLTAILPDMGIRCTCSTADPRALALYIRAGMRPRWPEFSLYGAGLPVGLLTEGTIDVEVASVEHLALLDWEREIGGRPRPEDFAYWAAHGATALWFRCAGAILGYAVVRARGGTVRHPDDATIGPIGVRRAEDATACTLAALRWTRARAANLNLTVPGPHPALATLLRVGFRIEDQYTFAASGDEPFYDPRRYISSGPDLL